MKKKRIGQQTARFQRAIAAGPPLDRYVLRLYVAGMNPRSSEAIRTVTEICEENLKHRYSLDVVDLYKQPAMAKQEQIIAAPTLIKESPLPLRRIIGSMADKHRVLLGLNLTAA